MRKWGGGEYSLSTEVLKIIRDPADGGHLYVHVHSYEQQLPDVQGLGLLQWHYCRVFLYCWFMSVNLFLPGASFQGRGADAGCPAAEVPGGAAEAAGAAAGGARDRRAGAGAQHPHFPTQQRQT